MKVNNGDKALDLCLKGAKFRHLASLTEEFLTNARANLEETGRWGHYHREMLRPVLSIGESQLTVSSWHPDLAAAMLAADGPPPERSDSEDEEGSESE